MRHVVVFFVLIVQTINSYSQIQEVTRWLSLPEVKKRTDTIRIANLKITPDTIYNVLDEVSKYIGGDQNEWYALNKREYFNEADTLILYNDVSFFWEMNQENCFARSKKLFSLKFKDARHFKLGKHVVEPYYTECGTGRCEWQFERALDYKMNEKFNYCDKILLKKKATYIITINEHKEKIKWRVVALQKGNFRSKSPNYGSWYRYKKHSYVMMLLKDSI